MSGASPSDGAGVAAQWRAAEQRYLFGGYAGLSLPHAIRHLPGRHPLVLTAPHAVTHRRRGHTKATDMLTGGLVEILAGLVDCHAVTADGPQDGDPNFDPDGPFKDYLTTLLPTTFALVDFHGMKDSHGPDVCIARGAGAPPAADSPAGRLASVVERELCRAGLAVSVGDPFDATPPHTVTSFARDRSVPAIELEIARRLRNPWDHPTAATALVEALTCALRHIATSPAASW